MKIRQNNKVVDIRCDNCGRYFYRDDKTNLFEGFNLINLQSLDCYNLCVLCTGQPFDIHSMKNPDNDIVRDKFPGLD